jgi:hypothetical protein
MLMGISNDFQVGDRVCSVEYGKCGTVVEISVPSADNVASFWARYPSLPKIDLTVFWVKYVDIPWWVSHYRREIRKEDL